MEIRVATWNMDHWKRRPKERAAAWGYLRGQLAPDVALLQETVPEERNASPELLVHRPGGINEHRRWGSAIVAARGDLRPIESARSVYYSAEVELLRTHPGIVTIGRWTDGSTEPITCVSVYGLIEQGYATTTMLRVIADLVPMFDDGELGERVILGGDFNVSTQLDTSTRSHARAVFGALKSLGMVDLFELTQSGRPRIDGCPCPDAPDCYHVQTHRHARSDKPWHNDYLFATAALAQCVTRLQVVAEEEPAVWAMSDHSPVVVGLDV